MVGFPQRMAVRAKQKAWRAFLTASVARRLRAWTTNAHGYLAEWLVDVDHVFLLRLEFRSGGQGSRSNTYQLGSGAPSVASARCRSNSARSLWLTRCGSTSEATEMPMATIRDCVSMWILSVCAACGLDQFT